MSNNTTAVARSGNSQDIAPFIVFRWLFGAVVLYGGVISIWKGDIGERFLCPSFYFKYYGWEWVQAPLPVCIYIAYALWILGAVGMMAGALYRWSVAAFFVGFTYLHLLDATNYINHYYLITILAAAMFFVPAHAECSIDRRLGLAPPVGQIAKGYLWAFRLQFALVYTFAGIAKLNTDWLLHALPLKIWLLQQADFPVLGTAFTWTWTPFVMSWVGALYDLTISGWLLLSRTRRWAYAAVLVFHTLTGLLFDIGLFPPLMIVGTLLFFPPDTHRRWLARWTGSTAQGGAVMGNKGGGAIAIAFFSFQLLFPLRHYWLYAGDVRWTEEGYRWGWRVMLFEKEGFATFQVQDTATGRFWIVENTDFLTPFQIKQMSTKPEHIRQYAHYLAQVYGQAYRIAHPVVTADVYVTYNGRPSRRLIRPNINLAAEPASFWGYDWVEQRE